MSDGYRSMAAGERWLLPVKSLVVSRLSPLFKSCAAWRWLLLSVGLWVLVFLDHGRTIPQGKIRLLEDARNTSNPFAPISVTGCTVYCADPRLDGARDQIRWLRDLLRQMERLLPHVQPVVVFYCRMIEAELVDGLGDLGPNTSLVAMPEPYFSDFNITVLSAFFLSHDLWRLLRGDKILFFQPDVWLCPQAEQLLVPFLKYDYVGAPWARGYSRGCELGVGNGGFSLRDRAAALRALRNPRTPGLVADVRARLGHAEDMVWCNIFVALNGRVPPPAEAARFSVENDDFGSRHPVGAHDCVHKPIILRLEAHCPGITAKMSEVQMQKRPVFWAVQTWLLPAFVVWDRVYYLWIFRYHLLSAVAVLLAVGYALWWWTRRRLADELRR